MMRAESFLGCIKLETFGRVYGWFHLICWILCLLSAALTAAKSIPELIKENDGEVLAVFAIVNIIGFCVLTLFIFISRRLINGVNEVSFKIFH